MQIEAVSADARLVDRLPRDGRSGVVHSVHDQVVNLRTPDGLLCCLSSDALDDAPRTVRVAAAGWARLTWAEGDPVGFLPGGLRHRGRYDVTTVALTDATRWQPALADLSAVLPARLRQVAGAIERQLRAPAARSPFELASEAELARRTDVLEAALRDADSPGIVDAARALIGLGAGLTPSGDDILTGLAVIASATGMRLATAVPALREAVTTGSPLESRTTAVSAATLAEAVDGRARARLHDLMSTIASGADEPALAAAVRQVRAIGHSSGADLLTGVRLGLVVEADLREEALLAFPSTPSKETL